MAKILIVDDEPSDLIGLSAVLERAGHEVLQASGGEEALDLYLAQHVHLVVTDMVMPGRDGLSLISAVMSVDPRAAVIAISGKSPGQLEASKIFGARKILTKPISPEDLVAAVDDVLESDGRGDE
jgi:DNA-binding NtrC family response regulator